jgi:hypothetical protein
MLDRRQLLHITAGAAATTGMLPGLASAGMAAAPADHPRPPVSAAEAHRTYARLVGDLSGKTVYFYNNGAVWGFLPQADDLTADTFAKHIYGSSGIAARKMRLEKDGSITMRQKFWAFYRDAQTDIITDRISNIYTGVVDTAKPMTGKTGERVLDAMVPGAPASDKLPYNMLVRRAGGRAFVSTSSISRINPGGIPWYKLEGTLENFACSAKDLDNQALTHVPCTSSLNVVAEWQTWTNMHGQPGHILFKVDGVPILSADEIPEDTLQAIDKYFPGEFAEVRSWKM